MAAEKHYEVKEVGPKSWMFHVWVWKNKKKEKINVLSEGHGYDTAQGAKKGMKASCDAYYGSWIMVKNLVKTVKLPKKK